MNYSTQATNTADNATTLAVVPFVRTEKTASNGWGAPESLLSNTDSTAYPLHALTGLVGKAIKEVVEIVKCPTALAANSALSVLSVAGQGVANVQPMRNLPPSPTSLYLLTIGESGERKTTADQFFSKALGAWAYQKRQDMESDLIRARAEFSAWEREIEGIKQAIQQAARKNDNTVELRERLIQMESSQPKQVYAPSMIFEDSTPESIAYDLAHKWPSAGVLSGEAGMVFGGHGMKSDNIIKNLATLNKLWGGEALTISRRGEGGSFEARDVRLSMGLAVQPSVIQDFYEQNGQQARGSGFSARFLTAWPSSTQGYRNLKLEEVTQQHPQTQLNLFYGRLHDLLERQLNHAKQGSLANLPTLQLSKDALEHWVTYFNAVENELRAGGEMEHFRDIASKSADNAARVAGLLHLFNGGDVLDVIQAETMEAATTLASWHLYEARRFFNELAVPTDLSNAIKLDTWLLNYCQTHQISEIGRRDIQRLAPNRVRQGTDLDKALNELEQANRVRQHIEGRKVFIEVNPDLLSHSSWH